MQKWITVTAAESGNKIVVDMAKAAFLSPQTSGGCGIVFGHKFHLMVRETVDEVLLLAEVNPTGASQSYLARGEPLLVV